MRVFSPSGTVFGGEHALIQLRLGSFFAKTTYPSPIKGEGGAYTPPRHSRESGSPSHDRPVCGAGGRWIPDQVGDDVSGKMHGRKGLRHKDKSGRRIAAPPACFTIKAGQLISYPYRPVRPPAPGPDRCWSAPLESRRSTPRPCGSLRPDSRNCRRASGYCRRMRCRSRGRCGR